MLTKGLALKPELTAARLRELLHYDPETGVFVRKVAQSSRSRVGQRACFVGKNGYSSVHVDGARYYAHRLAWLYVTGNWPQTGVDHRNGVRTDNAFRNLREATQAENMQNTAISPSNTSGRPGVTWNKAERKWQAQIKVGGRRYQLGKYRDIELAAAAYIEAKKNLHRFNPNVRCS